ncbi:MAG: cobyrinic acid a,c-diamide synthase, partial [Clostridium sp.]
IEAGIPTIAECGGFMYLQKAIKDKEGNEFQMVNVIDSTSQLTNKLSRFGYTTLTALKDNLLFKTGEQVNAHEFHYSDSDLCGEDFLAVKPITGRKWHCIHGQSTMIAGYPHIHLWGNIKVAQRFISACLSYKEK